MAIPNPTLGGFFDETLFDAFGYGFDVDINTYVPPQKGVKRFEVSAAGQMHRTEQQRFEVSAKGQFKRVDD